MPTPLILPCPPNTYPWEDIRKKLWDYDLPQDPSSLQEILGKVKPPAAKACIPLSLSSLMKVEDIKHWKSNSLYRKLVWQWLTCFHCLEFTTLEEGNALFVHCGPSGDSQDTHSCPHQALSLLSFSTYFFLPFFFSHPWASLQVGSKWGWGGGGGTVPQDPGMVSQAPVFRTPKSRVPSQNQGSRDLVFSTAVRAKSSLIAWQVFARSQVTCTRRCLVA